MIPARSQECVARAWLQKLWFGFTSGPAPSHPAPALLPILWHDLPQLLRLSILVRSIPATIHNKLVSAFLGDVPQTSGYEAKHLAENRDLCVKPLFFHRPSITSTYDSAESIATRPPESDLDEQIRALVVSPLCLQEREASADRSQFLSLCKKKILSHVHLEVRRAG